MSLESVNPDTCPNCGAGLADQPRPPQFCPACGQELRVKAPTLGEFAQQFGGAYLSTEGALWRTFKLLLLQPGELTRQYLAGRRKHYVLPLRLYLTISVLVLLVLRLTAGAVQVSVKDAPPGAEGAAGAPKNLQINLIAGRAGLREGKFYCEELPRWMCQRLEARLTVGNGQLQPLVESLRDRFLGHLAPGMFLLLPTFALWMKLAYWNRRLHYTEHLVFALHVHAFWFIALGLTLFELPWLGGLAAFSVPVYTLLAMRRVYGGRWWPLLLRAATVSLVHSVAMTLGLTAVGVAALLI